MLKKCLIYVVICFVILAANALFPLVPTWVALVPLLAPVVLLVLVLWLVCLVGVGIGGGVMLLSALISWAEYRNRPQVNEKKSQTAVAQKMLTL